MRVSYTSIIAVLMLLVSFNAKAQVHNITCSLPQTHTAGTIITPLSPLKIIAITFDNSGSLAGGGVQIYPNPNTGIIKKAAMPTAGEPFSSNNNNTARPVTNLGGAITYCINIIMLTAR